MGTHQSIADREGTQGKRAEQLATGDATPVLAPNLEDHLVREFVRRWEVTGKSLCELYQHTVGVLWVNKNFLPVVVVQVKAGERPASNVQPSDSDGRVRDLERDTVKACGCRNPPSNPSIRTFRVKRASQDGNGIAVLPLHGIRPTDLVTGSVSGKEMSSASR